MFRQVNTGHSIENIKSADLAKLVSIYRKLVLKIGFATNHLWFNTMCKKRGVLPKYTNFKITTQSSQGIRALKQARHTWLNLTIRDWYRTRNNLALQLKVAHTELLYRLHPVEFIVLDEKIRDECQEKCYLQYMKQKDKLDKLQTQRSIEVLHNSPVHSPLFYPRFKNLTDVEFSSSEIKFLNQGIKYSPPPLITQNIVIDLSADIEAATSDQTQQLKAACALQIKKSVSKPNLNNVINPNLKSIKQKLTDNNLILCKADKGNTCTVLTKIDYDNKIKDFIATSNAQPLIRDPTPTFKANVINCIKNCPTVFIKSDVDDGWKYKNMNPSAPILYGLPKLHKDTIPIRPIVSYCTAPSFKLCKKFIELFIESTTFASPYSIKNSTELVNKIRSSHIPCNSKLVSFDVVSLFPSIPVDTLTEIVFNYLNNDVECDTYRDELKRIYNTCVTQNYFRYDNTHYIVSEGLPMGSPLSPLLAEIFMSHFETFIMSDKNPYKQLINFWYRYVDDVLCLWLGTERQLNAFVNFLNKQYRTIDFTIEKETNSRINYLDITITRNNNKLDFSIYRKPTFCDSIIPANSNHPHNSKMSAFHSMLERLLNIPMNQDNFNIELNTIFTIAENNGYNRQIIKRLLQKKQHKLILKQVYPINTTEETKNYRRLQYLGKISQTLRNTLENHSDINIAFYNHRTISNLLFNNKEHLDPLLNSGVYKINCSDCDCYYVGQTGRSFKTRIKEHLRTNNTDSAFSNHLLLNNHTSSIDHVDILHKQCKGKKLTALESFEIRKGLLYNDNILNEQKDIKFSPLTDPSFLLNNNNNNK